MAVFNRNFYKIGRMAMISSVYPQIRDLIPLRIPGPASTMIYALVEPQHYALIGRRLRAVVERRIPVLERVIEERAEAERTVLPKVRRMNMELFEVQEADKEEHALQTVTHDELALLSRLSHWLGKGESPVYHDSRTPF